MRKWWSNVVLVLAVLGMFAVAMYFGARATSGDDEAFVGTDTTATEHIQDANPEYAPWFAPVFEPSAEVESGLFAAQAAVGAGVLGFALGALWQRSRSRGRRSTGGAVPAQTVSPAENVGGPHPAEQG